MPHQCISCDERYEDGSESVLTGCVECGGSTFQYVPEPNTEPTAASERGKSDTEASPDPDEPTHSSSVLGGGFIRTGRDTTPASPEDASQHSARTDVVDLSDLPSSGENPTRPDSAGRAGHDEPEVDLEMIRRELNRQFEGIHIVAPGHYELNLMELYRQEDCIITLHEDGRYAISVPGDDEFSIEETE